MSSHVRIIYTAHFQHKHFIQQSHPSVRLYVSLTDGLLMLRFTRLAVADITSHSGLLHARIVLLLFYNGNHGQFKCAFNTTYCVATWEKIIMMMKIRVDVPVRPAWRHLR